MKILTVASVVGIPPVLIAGLYGMNFKNMPELNWVWGVPFCFVLDSFDYTPPANLVQVEELDLIPQRANT
jgi:hypothetical protein